MSQKNELIEIAKLFFKLGSIGFGGLAAHIAMMEDEVVKKAVKNTELAILGILTLVICSLGVNEIIALFGCSLLGLALYSFKKTQEI